MHVARRLVVEGHQVGPRLGEAGNVLFGLDNHQMDVEELARGLADGLQHGKSERDVGDEDPVHDVDVDEGGTALLDHANVPSEVHEIGGQD